MLSPAKLWQGVLVKNTAAVRHFGEEADPAKRLKQKWGEAIRGQREALDLTLEQVAALMSEAGYHVTAAAIGMWERGETAPKWHNQMAVAKVLGTTRSVLFQDVA